MEPNRRFQALVCLVSDTDTSIRMLAASLWLIAATGVSVHSHLRKRKMAAPPIGNMKAVPAKLQELMNENLYSLPRLPVPALEDTLARYLASVKPFCDTPDEYAAQEALVEEFKAGTGAQLHADLVQADGDHEVRCPGCSPCWAHGGGGRSNAVT